MFVNDRAILEFKEVRHEGEFQMAKEYTKSETAQYTEAFEIMHIAAVLVGSSGAPNYVCLSGKADFERFPGAWKNENSQISNKK